MYRLGESQYYYDSSGLYRKVKLTPQGYHIKDKHGKLRWFTQKDLERIVNMTMSSSQNDTI